MSYALASLIAGQSAACLGAGLFLFLKKRNLLHLTWLLIGPFFSAVLLLLSSPLGGRSIDVAMGVILFGAYRNHPLGFQWLAFAAGAMSILLFVLSRLDKQRALYLIAGLYALELFAAHASTTAQRLERLEAKNNGLRILAGRATHRVMIQPVELLDDQFTVEPVLRGLTVPASIELARDGTLFVGEQNGAIRALKPGETEARVLYTLTPIRASSESGLIDLELHPNFPDPPQLYAYYSEGRTWKNRLVRLTLRDLSEVVETKVILDDLPGHWMHNGGGLAFGPDGKLYLGMGTADYNSAARESAVPSGPQGWEVYNGKVLRLEPDGTVPKDNPRSGSLIYALGVREVFRIKLDPLSQRLFMTENGIGEHDEINVLFPGGNYGYPEYTGLTGVVGHEDPILDIYKSIGITGIEFYSGDAYPERYQNDLFFCSHVTGLMYHLPLERDPKNRVPRGPARSIRFSDPAMNCKLDLELGPDGKFYFSNDQGVFRLEYAGDAAATAERELDGHKLYSAYCAPCHQAAGTGIKGTNPPLAGSEWVLGDPQTLARIVLFGVKGEMEVRGEKYNLQMLPFGPVLDDEQLASLLTHLRSSWGNNAPAVDAALVAQERAAGVPLRLP